MMVTRTLELLASAALAAAEATAAAGGGPPLPPPMMPNVVSTPITVAIVAITPLNTFQPAPTRASRRCSSAKVSAAGGELEREGARLNLVRVVEGSLSMIVAPNRKARSSCSTLYQ
jgi:hypothetical protein